MSSSYLTRKHVVDLKEVTRVFPGPSPVRALNGCSLRVVEGEFVALMGRSGSGKSTLLHIIGLLDRPTEGSCNLFGMDTHTLGSKERARLRASRIGFVFQSFHLINYLTAIENVELGLAYGRVPLQQRREHARETLESLELGHRLDAYPKTLSGGEQQRVAIGRAVAKRPALVLCDEPTGNLDTTSTTAVLDSLVRLNRHGLTIVVVTHDESIAARAQRVYLMEDGRIQSTRNSYG